MHSVDLIIWISWVKFGTKFLKMLKEVGHTFVVMVCILPILNSNMASFWDCYF